MLTVSPSIFHTPSKVQVMKTLLILCFVFAFIAAQTQPQNEPVTQVPAIVPPKDNVTYPPEGFLIASLLPPSKILMKYKNPKDPQDEDKKPGEREDGIPTD